MGDERLYRLGLLHLKDKPDELRAELDKRLAVYDERRRKLNQNLEQQGAGATKSDCTTVEAQKNAAVKDLGQSEAVPAPPPPSTPVRPGAR
jgi:hypothetical protein